PEVVGFARGHEITCSGTSRTFSIGVPCQTIGFEPIDEIWLIYLIATITIICNPEITATDQSYVVRLARVEECGIPARRTGAITRTIACDRDRKSTRLNSSHVSISYAVFCLKKKKK